MGEEEGPIKAEEGIRGPRFEALAGRLSRRGGSTPPEGDLGARRKAQGTAARCRRHGEERGPLSWPAPAARRVIASPGQASRVRPLLRTISTPPSPASPFPRDWRSIGPHSLLPLPLPPPSAASFSSRSVVSSIPRRPPRALLVLVRAPPPSQPPSPLFSHHRLAPTWRIRFYRMLASAYFFSFFFFGLCTLPLRVMSFRVV